MAVSNNIINTRIQLKSDTEANWNKLAPKDGAAGFVPLNGELIVYSADSTHPYSRAKIGDGLTNIVNLPFIDAGTINGDAAFVEKYNNFNAFPSPGSTKILYIDLSTNNIYHYTAASGYRQLANMTINTTKTSIKDVVYWGPGSMTNASVTNGILNIKNGIAPQLLTQNVLVVTDVQGGNAE